MNVQSIRNLVIAGGLAAMASQVMADDSLYHKPITNEVDRINQHFEIASKDFGDGKVNLHARSDGPDGSTHTIFSFDCKNKRHEILFSGAQVPDGFSHEQIGNPADVMAAQDGVAPFAQHACTTHGYPILQW